MARQPRRHHRRQKPRVPNVGFNPLDVSGIAAVGAWDPLAALILCGPTRVRDLIVEGQQVVADGRRPTIDLPHLIARQTALARRLMDF